MPRFRFGSSIPDFINRRPRSYRIDFINLKRTTFDQRPDSCPARPIGRALQRCRLKHGGSMYASGGKVAKRDTPPRGGENYSGMGKPYTPGGKRPSLRKDIKYGMKQDSKRAKQDYKAPEGMTEFGTAKAATTAPTARPMPPARPAVMPMARPAVMPVRPGMAKGGMAKDGVASKGKTSTKMVKMASGGSFRAADGIASKGKTKGRMC